MLIKMLTKVFGSRNDRTLRRMRKVVNIINGMEPAMEKLSDDELKAKTAEFRARLEKGETLDDLLPEALVKELQRYVQGEYLYIPTDGTQRKGWGERSGARQMLDARNRAIRQAFRQGVSPEALGEQYHLSPASIRRIVYTK